MANEVDPSQALDFWVLGHLSDRQVLERLAVVVGSGRRLLAELVAHLGEVEERRLHLEAACGSMFDYCVKRLGLSEDEACRRIEVARLARRFPAIFGRLAAGELSLSVAALLKPHLTLENADALLIAVGRRSVRQAREVLASLFPKPDAPSSVRKLPGLRSSSMSPAVAVALAPQCGVEVVPADGGTLVVPPPDVIEWLSSGSSLPCGSAPFNLSGSFEVAPSISPSPSPSPSAGSSPYASLSTAPSAAFESSVSPAASVIATALFMPSVPAAAVASVAHHTSDGGPRVDPTSRSGARGTRGKPSSRAPARIEPTSAGRYKVQFTADAELKRKLELARDLMRHAVPSGDLGRIVDRALDLLIEQLMQRRFGVRRRPTTRSGERARPSGGATATSPAESPTPGPDSPAVASASALSSASLPSPGPRATSSKSDRPERQVSEHSEHSKHVCRAARRAVVERDGLRCSWVSEDGVRCEASAWLEIDHRFPRGKGGGSEPENLRLLCRNHNRLAAEREYGKAKIADAIATRESVRRVCPEGDDARRSE